mgnify:CR=1 FL=1
MISITGFWLVTVYPISKVAYTHLWFPGSGESWGTRKKDTSQKPAQKLQYLYIPRGTSKKGNMSETIENIFVLIKELKGKGF